MKKQLLKLRELMVKVCIDPSCNEVAHNIEKKETRCRTCNGIMVRINEKTYLKKFSDNFFQFDYLTDKYFRPAKNKQLKLDIL